MVTNLLIIARMAYDLMTGGDPALPSGHNELAPIARCFSAIRDYLASVILDGDYLNDWLAHIPHALQTLLLFAGHLLAIIGGN